MKQHVQTIAQRSAPTREWKPGDVAMATYKHFAPTPAMYNSGRRSWIDADGAEFDGGEDELTIRPLAVLDPDSPSDQRRILDLLRNSGAFRGVVSQDIALDCIGDALREFATPTPPKPDEPQGRAATVEATCACTPESRIYVRDEDAWRAETPWQARCGSHPWEKLTAVRVLSEGVTA